jgi:DNA repair protein RecO (recombination protein O)
MTNVHLPRLVTVMLTRVSDQPAYLLHRRDWQNTSLILDLLTYDFGRVSVLAKGGKNSRSKAFYQPFTRLSVSWTGRHELKTLVDIDGVSLPVAEDQYLPLLYINELISVFLPAHEPNPEMFQLYGLLLQSIDQKEADLREFERELMHILGYLPDTQVEAKTRMPIDASAHYQFLASDGFVMCSEERQNAIDGASIIDWNEKNYENPVVVQMAKAVMRCIIDFNLHGRQLKSRTIYRQIQNHL